MSVSVGFQVSSRFMAITYLLSKPNSNTLDSNVSFSP